MFVCLVLNMLVYSLSAAPVCSPQPRPQAPELPRQQGLHLLPGQAQPGGHSGPRDLLPRRKGRGQRHRHQQLQEDRQEHQGTELGNG